MCSSDLAEMLTTSDNTTAELLLKEIGRVGKQRGTRDDGIAVMLQRLTSWGVPLDGVEFHDGSGLSDDNRTTCAAIGALLDRYSLDDPLVAGLPVAGATGGTLANAFIGTALEGQLRAKTGTLSNYSDGPGGKPGAKALSGYLPVAGGGSIRFTLVLNGATITDGSGIGTIQDDHTVRGGTGWGAEFAKLCNKPLFVFDQDKNGWFMWDGEHDTWIRRDRKTHV